MMYKILIYWQFGMAGYEATLLAAQQSKTDAQFQRAQTTLN